MKKTFWFVLPFIMHFIPVHAGAQDKAQSDALASLVDPYPAMYNYSTMPDTVIRQVGNYMLMSGKFVIVQEPAVLCCAAERTIRVRSGKLKEVVITDTGSGYIITLKYKKGRLVKMRRKFDVRTVRNVPPYH